MILMMDRPLTHTEVWQYAGLIALGGFWYLAISLSSVQLLPYRAAQQALGECVHAISKFLLIKAEFYNTSTDLEEDYRKLLAQQVTVSEKQDAVRELLFKSRQIVKESTSTGRMLVLTFVDVIDLYEQIVAMYYDYRLDPGAVRPYRRPARYQPPDPAHGPLNWITSGCPSSRTGPTKATRTLPTTLKRCGSGLRTSAKRTPKPVIWCSGNCS